MSIIINDQEKMKQSNDQNMTSFEYSEPLLQ